MFDIRAHDTSAPAPGDLELLQRFVNLHEHVPGAERGSPPPREMLERFLVERGLLGAGERFTGADRATALGLIDALHAKVRASAGERMSDAHVALIDRLADRAGLHPRFGHDGPDIVAAAGGASGALGRIVAIAFLADLGGTWGHLKECAAEDCDAVFYDRSKNHSGRWHSMATCGNRAKVRAWRERQAPMTRLERRAR